MHKLWLIIKREYVTRVHTKGFVIGTIAFPLLFIGMLAFSVVAATRQADHTLKIAILDNAGGLATSIASRLNERLPNGQPAVEVARTFDQPHPEEELRQELVSQVRQGQLDGYLVVPKETLEGKPAELHTKNTGDIRLTVSMARAVSEAVIARRLSDQGIKIENLGNSLKEVDITLIKVTKEGETEEKGQTIATAIIVAMVLYMTLLIYGVATMRSVLEEKTTRIVEILVASVRPFQLLAGKVLGVAAVALTQYLIWSISGGLLASGGTVMAAALRPGVSIPRIHLPFSLLIYVFVFFLGGYLLYASLFAATGAMVSNEQDMQQAQMPVTMLIVTAIVLFSVIMRNPNSPLSIVLSMIPFFAPILMLLRIALQTPPFWQIALSLVLLALTTIGVVYFSARIYRVGVLMYGKRPSLVEVFRWLRYT